MLRTDREYRRGFTAMMVNQSGDGLVTGGSLLLLTSLAAANPPLAAIGLAVFTLVEISIAAASFIRASHLRDNAEALRRDSTQNASARSSDQAQHIKRLRRSGFIDAGAAGVLALGVAGASLFGLGPAAAFTGLVAVKGIQAYNKSYENGAWNCLKYNLGTEETQRQQLDMRATIGAMEMGVGGMIYGVASLATYVALYGAGILCPPALPFIGLGTAVLGGAITSMSKVLFARWCARTQGTGINPGF